MTALPPVPDFSAAVREGGSAVRGVLGEARDRILASRRAAGGLATARALADLVDALVRSFVDSRPERAGPFAVLAVGGYGRGELSPFSDVDLMVVAHRRPPSVREIAGDLGALLWDAGLTVNLTLRTPRALLQAMGRDHTIASSLLDHRVLAGEPATAAAVRDEILRPFLARRGEWFVAEKAAEARRRRAARGGTPCSLEPDVKESPGGLRDVHVIRWLSALAPPEPEDEELLAALDGILAFRAELHLLAGHKQDVLDLGTQKDLAPLLLPDDPGPPEERHLRAMAPWFRAARVAARHCDRALGAGDPPGGAVDLRAVLASPGPVAPALRALHRRGRLAALLPEWAVVESLPQCDPYHAWTVDEHTLRCFDALDDAAAGRGPGGARLGSEAALLPSPLVLRLALLLHDVGKARGAAGHAARGAEEIRGVPDRLGLTPAEARAVVKLVADHAAMGEASAFAVHGDEGPVRRVAGIAGDRESLRLLLLHTAADIGGVGHGAWSAWRAAQLLDFHARVEAVLRGAPAFPADLGEALREILPPRRWPEAAAFIAGASHRYAATVAPETARLHLDLLRRRGRRKAAAVAAAVERPGAVEFTVAAADRPHLLADLAGALTLAGLDILSADAHTLRDGTALDAFAVRAPVPARRKAVAGFERAASAEPGTVEAAVRRFAARVPSERRSVPDPRVEARRADDGTGEAAEFRVDAPDRPGLLHDLARALSDAGLDLHQVRVATLGPRALDAFFVSAGGRLPSGPETERVLVALREAAGRIQ
jgi:UTP:GlnB (protein PII) uridylyltransferase